MCHIYISDSLQNDIENHLADEDASLRNLPICASCGDPIQQETAVCLGGRWYCDWCLDFYRENIDY